MRLFLDTEFNSYQGELISIAIVSEEGHEWYEVLGCDNPHPWVQENVIPILNKEPIASKLLLSKSLEQFLSQFSDIHLYADWPEDLKYFNEVLITGPGERIDTPMMTMEIVRIDAPSELPHNALADAKGIRDYLVKR